MRLGPVGFQPSVLRVHWLEAGMSRAAKWASQPKCSAALSWSRETTGIFRPLPMVSAISRRVTPSSWNGVVDRDAGAGLLHRHPVEAGDVGERGGGPAVCAVADVGREALPAGRLRKVRHQTLLAGVMHLG